MAYNATYESADLDDIAIDFVGTYGAQIVVFAALIALAVLYVWFRKRM